MTKSVHFWNFFVCLVFCAILTPAVMAQSRGWDRDGRDRDDWRRRWYQEQEMRRRREYYDMGGDQWRGPSPYVIGRSGDSGRSSEESRREESRDSDDHRSSETGPKKTMELKSKPRVTVDLPEEYTAGDLDTDGQVGFYEWRQWKRGSMPEFLALDHNGDGFLTPRELQAGPKVMPLVTVPTGLADGSRMPAGTTVSPAVRPVGTSSGTPMVRSVEVAPTAVDPVVIRQAESKFRSLDRNNDGNVTLEEWKRSKKLRPQFESAGVDLSVPMPRETFVQHYVRLTSADS